MRHIRAVSALLRYESVLSAENTACML